MRPKAASRPLFFVTRVIFRFTSSGSHGKTAQREENLKKAAKSGSYVLDPGQRPHRQRKRDEKCENRDTKIHYRQSPQEPISGIGA